MFHQFHELFSIFINLTMDLLEFCNESIYWENFFWLLIYLDACCVIILVSLIDLFITIEQECYSKIDVVPND